ncbi:TauD/TfdA family dioxygenase [Rhodovibrionaceae bacterium A322]
MSRPFNTSSPLPLVFTGSGDWTGLQRDLKEGQDRFRAKLLENGALLFRGYDVETAEQFQQICEVLTPDLQKYVGGLSPRSPVFGRVYTSTSYSARQKIPLHNEACYLPEPPRTLYFCCETPSSEKGATPLGDLQLLYSRLSDRLKSAFAQRLFRYHVNVHGGQGFGKSWQQMFATEDQDEVSALLHSRGVSHRWSEDTSLTLTYIAPAIRTHSVTGVPYWSAQLLVWHHANLPSAVSKGLFSTYGCEEKFPRAVFFEDGSKIADDLILELAELTEEMEQRFDWQKGDVLMVDNERIGHGREPFDGSRSVWVAMA